MRNPFYLLLALFSMSCGNAREDFLESIQGLSSEKSTFFSGQYNTGCIELRAASGAGSVFARDSLEFIGFEPTYGAGGTQGARVHEVRWNTQVYSDSRCTQEAFRSEISGKYSFGSGGKELSILSEKGTLKPQDSTAVRQFQSSRICGTSDWNLNSEKAVTPESCPQLIRSENYFFHTLNAQVSAFELIQCSDEEFKNCIRIPYVKQTDEE
jgi:hypothetical protein